MQSAWRAIPLMAVLSLSLAACKEQKPPPPTVAAPAPSATGPVPASFAILPAEVGHREHRERSSKVHVEARFFREQEHLRTLDARFGAREELETEVLTTDGPKPSSTRITFIDFEETAQKPDEKQVKITSVRGKTYVVTSGPDGISVTYEKGRAAPRAEQDRVLASWAAPAQTTGLAEFLVSQAFGVGKPVDVPKGARDALCAASHATVLRATFSVSSVKDTDGKHVADVDFTCVLSVVVEEGISFDTDTKGIGRIDRDTGEVISISQTGDSAVKGKRMYAGAHSDVSGRVETQLRGAQLPPLAPPPDGGD